MLILRHLTLLVCLGLVSSLALGQTPSVADRTLVAEGDTVNQARHFTLGHWRLWRLHSGEYEVAESQAGGNSVVQTFRFDKHFLPSGFSLWADRTLNHPGSHPFSISCNYAPKELHCDTDFDGHKSTASVTAKQPYVFVPGEYYALDFCWFLTGILRLATNGNSDQPVNLYGMVDRPGHIGEIDLEPDSEHAEPMRLPLLGEVTAEALGKSQKLKRYDWGKPSRLIELRATSRSIVVSVGENPAEALILSGYKEYESWDPEK